MERYSQIHDTQHSPTHANYTKIARGSIAGMSYASTTLYDSTYSSRFTAHDLGGRCTRASRYAFRDTPNPGERQTVPYQLRPALRSSLSPQSLVSGRPKLTKIESSGQSPIVNETRNGDGDRAAG